MEKLTIEQLTSTEAQKALKLASLTGYLVHEGVKSFMHAQVETPDHAQPLGVYVKRAVQAHFDSQLEVIGEQFNRETDPIDFDEYIRQQEVTILHQGVVVENMIQLGLWPV